ncbi:amino acid ABC transporter ATP-binding protein [Lachnospiraceae bacterium 38-14]|jgi:polar amino acid transport system ATP-binding protein|uniref:amino acid ABC transporter ATP-binding protein n=1 Tax=Roseburia sp. 1XD42-69 TaxID=2320088 RepID=UPI000EA231CC|nr:amino acid ABC transporter ATP-binding protein [Roseburia sp. 1XD42-69]RKJ61814.1 amino acid ABC transporter ATP-binding protein [Roseburia sp. 1XD42-69]
MADTVLEIRNLVKKFDGHIILNDLDMNVQEGEVVVILGPSGCGKSTLLRCINGLEEIQSGSVRIQGKEISGTKENAGLLRQKVGMVFQSYDLFPHLSVLGNIMLSPVKVQKRKKDEVKEEALELLKKVGLADKADSYPRQLSGGQKQRVAIVRALILHPEILLFDEVTAALDPEMVREVLDVILSLAKQGKTMLIVTHEMQFAKAVADRIVFIDEGKIMEEGTAKEFFEHPQTERAKKFLHVFSFEDVR